MRRATLFSSGSKESAGIFSYTQSWVVMAEALQGDGDQAYANCRAFMPCGYNDRRRGRARPSS